MTDNVIDVLVFLFSHYMDDDTEIEPDHESMTRTLQAAGFHDHEISRAMDWLDGLAAEDDETDPVPGDQSLRVYTAAEQQKLDIECRGFMLFLEQAGILKPNSREKVIERVMALDDDDTMDLEQLKWVVMMVLFNRPGEELAYAQMEDLVFEPNASYTQ